MAIIELKIQVDNIEQVTILYDQLQVFRSVDQSGSPNPYISLTETTPTSASIDGTIKAPWNLDATSLSVTVDGADPVNISFSGAHPFTFVEVMNRINTVLVDNIVTEVPSNVPEDTDLLRLTSPSVGSQSVIQVSGSAASILGLPTTRISGKGANPLLSPNTEFYQVLDLSADQIYWYKSRFVNSLTRAVSTFSTPFLATPGTGLSSSFLVTGFIALADVSGNPIVGRRIIFIPVSSQVINDGAGHNYGVLPSVERITGTTDLNGRMSISLVKGQILKVFIEGTSFQREFQVPTTDFDILTLASVQPDPLSIVNAPQLAIRVS